MQAMGETQGAVNDYVRVGDSIHSLDGKLRICHTFPTICSLARILTLPSTPMSPATVLLRDQANVWPNAREVGTYSDGPRQGETRRKNARPM